MSFVKSCTWCFLSVLGTISILSCNFTTQLSYSEVLLHLAILTAVHFALVFPPEDLLDSFGLTLFDLFAIFYYPEDGTFMEYVLYKRLFFMVFVAAYPAVVCAYFVHGNLFMSNQTDSRFPMLLDNPVMWMGLLVIFIIATIAFYYWNRDIKKSPFYRYLMENPGCENDVEDLVDEPDTLRIRFPQHSALYCNRQYFVYVSNWRYVAVKQSDVRLQVDATRMPLLPQNADEERLRHIYVKVSFRQSYLKPFTISLRHDLYRQLNDALEIPIFVPPHIRIPLTIMEELKEDFATRVDQNDLYRHRVKAEDLEPCFACGTEENIVKIVKTCADNNERWQWSLEGERVFTDRCQPCVCRPLWCVSCIAQIFIGKQNTTDMFRHDFWRGTSPCPTCRKPFCIRDVHLVEFIMEED